MVLARFKQEIKKRNIQWFLMQKFASLKSPSAAYVLRIAYIDFWLDKYIFKPLEQNKILKMFILGRIKHVSYQFGAPQLWAYF